jgi:hypothetical protein
MGETNFKPIQISLPEKQESPDDIDLLKNRNFNWEIPFFANMDQELLDFGEKIYDIGAIEDVYLDNSGKVVIEHKLECNDNNFSVGSTIKTMRIPLNIPDHAKLGCKNKDKYKCTMSAWL